MPTDAVRAERSRSASSCSPPAWSSPASRNAHADGDRRARHPGLRLGGHRLRRLRRHRPRLSSLGDAAHDRARSRARGSCPGLIGPALAGHGDRCARLALGLPRDRAAGASSWAWPSIRSSRALGRRQRRPRCRCAATRTARSMRVRLAVGSTLLLAALTIGSLPLALLLVAGGGWLAIGALRHLLPAGHAAPGAAAARRWWRSSSPSRSRSSATEAFVPLSRRRGARRQRHARRRRAVGGGRDLDGRLVAPGARGGRPASGARW